MPRIRTLVLTVAAGTAFAVGAGGVGYAVATTAATTKTVSACANKYGRLAVKSNAGTCPKGFSAVTLNKQGPRGATGKQGPVGPQGPQGDPGPAARDFDYQATTTESARPFYLGGLRYQAQCQLSGGIAITRLDVYAGGAATVSASGTNVLYIPGSNPTTSIEDDAAQATITFQIGSPVNARSHRYVQGLRVVTSSGETQSASFDLVAQSIPGSLRCEIKGTIIPTD